MVAGEGPKDARGMIVGEAPGFQEVEQGRPFVGKSGRLLDTALKALGVPREEVYITNVVKDIPLNSEQRVRRPYPEEIDAWNTMLAIEITEVAPLGILCLGRVAVDHLMGLGTGFGDQSGTYYSAWHPAYVLRQQDNIDVFGIWIDEQMRPWADVVRV